MVRLAKSKDEKNPNQIFSVDIQVSSYFGGNEESKEEGFELKKFKSDLFREPCFETHRETYESRKKKILNASKDTEGSVGPCIRCKSTNTTEIVKQKRSADEPINFTTICGNCGANYESR